MTQPSTGAEAIDHDPVNRYIDAPPAVNPAADPAWVAARDAAGKMTPADADAYYSQMQAQRDAPQAGGR